MTKTVENPRVAVKKASYTAPRLTVYGSVRELTGNNSGTFSGDSNTMMAVF